MNEEIRRRLAARMRRVGFTSARELAHHLDQPAKNAQRYLSGKVQTIPPDFLVACERAGFATVRWLATGEGPEDPAQQRAQNAAGSRYMGEVAEVVDRWRGVSPLAIEDEDRAALEELDPDRDGGPPGSDGSSEPDESTGHTRPA